MPLLGKGALVMWCDIAPEHHAAHDEWHSNEHFLERLGIPGFLRARRGVSISGNAPRYFVLYEVDQLATIASPAYLARLNNPSVWTRSIMALVQRLSRTPSQVTASHGSGIGAYIQAVRLTPRDDGAGSSELRRWLVETALPSLMSQPGVVGAHLLEHAPAWAPQATHEQALRGRADDTADWILVVEGYSAANLESATARLLPPDEVIRRGAAGSPVSGFYQIAHMVTPADLPPSEPTVVDADEDEARNHWRSQQLAAIAEGA